MPIADSAAIIDNAAVAGNALTPSHLPLIRRVEHWLIALGMTVIAYLLEKVILRSVRDSGPKV